MSDVNTAGDRLNKWTDNVTVWPVNLPPPPFTLHPPCSPTEVEHLRSENLRLLKQSVADAGKIGLLIGALTSISFNADAELKSKIEYILKNIDAAQ